MTPQEMEAASAATPAEGTAAAAEEPASPAKSEEEAGWAIVGTIAVPDAGDSFRTDVFVDFAHPPTVSNPLIAPDYAADPENHTYVVAVKPLTRLFLLCVPKLDDAPAYFFCDARGSATRLPCPAAAGCPILDHRSIGLVVDPLFASNHIVAELQPAAGAANRAALLCYSRATGRWDRKDVRGDFRPHPSWGCDGVIAHEGWLWWVDLAHGLQGCDPFVDSPRLRHVPLPQGSVMPVGGHADLVRTRCVRVSAGKLRYVHLHGDLSENDMLLAVAMWTLEGDDAGWVPEYDVPLSEIWADRSYEDTKMPRRAPVIAAVNPQNPREVYFFLDAWIFAVDVPARRVIQHGVCRLVQPRPDLFSSRYVHAWELPPSVRLRKGAAASPSPSPAGGPAGGRAGEEKPTKADAGGEVSKPKESKLMKKRQMETKAAMESELSKKRKFVKLDHEGNYTEDYGDVPLICFQTMRTCHRARIDISQIGPDTVGQTVMVQGWAQSIKKIGKSSILLVLRDGLPILHCLLMRDTAYVTEDMVAFVRAIPKESFIHVEGLIQMNDNKVQLAIERLFCIQRSHGKLPFLLEDAARGEHEQFDKRGNKLAHVSLTNRLDNRFIDLRVPATQAIFWVQCAVESKFTQMMLNNGFLGIHSPKITPGISEGGSEVFELQYHDKIASLAQSPQLYKQMAINGGVKKVFEIGPVFRAEKSNTHRHLCEYVGLHAEMQISKHYFEVCDLVGSIFVSIFDDLSENHAETLRIVKQQFPCEDLKYLRETLMVKYSDGIKMLNEAGYKVKEFEGLSNKEEKQLGQIIREKYKTDFYILYEYPLAVRPFYTMPCSTTYSNSFDAFIRGEEVLSGGQRIHDLDVLLERIAECGINKRSLQGFLESFECGAPPRGGFGAGLERFVMLYLALPDIRMASLYPRDRHRLTP